MDEGLRAIADTTRRRILRLVWSEELTAGEIAAKFDISRPAVSQHLAVLLEAGLVEVRREGTRRYYSTRRKSLQALRAFLEEFWDESLARLKQEAEKEQRRKSKNDGN